MSQEQEQRPNCVYYKLQYHRELPSLSLYQEKENPTYPRMGDSTLRRICTNEPTKIIPSFLSFPPYLS